VKPAFGFRAASYVLVLLFGAGCAETSSLFEPTKPDPAAQMPALETRIYQLIQDKRHEIDPKALTLALDPELVTIARKRSAEMARRNSFLDDSGDPHVSATMLMAADAQFQGLVGENVAAQHFTAQSGIEVDVFAQRFVESWLASKPHLENLSFADYNRTGVGAAANGDTVYVTQLFTTDLGLGPHSDSAPPSQVVPVANPRQGKDDSAKVPLRGAIVPSAPSQ
jgi:uncharacterized protein YkwD